MADTLLDWLLQRYPASSRQTLKRMLEAGRVRVNGKVARKFGERVAAGDEVVVADRAAARAAALPPPPADLRVVYEDGDVLVVDKPAGLLTSTVPREPRPTLLAKVAEYLARRDPRARVGLIHRLDRDASGLLVFSKNEASYESLKTQFFEHSVERVYAAVVRGVPAEPKGRIESRLIERADGSVHSTRQTGKGQRAVTDYEVLAARGKTSLLRVTLHTGRKHQIRAHLSERGHAILGDRMYGPAKGGADGNLLLIAKRLAFAHPRTGKRVEFELELPAEFGAGAV
jgi:23S rRNA pseudouridine1911/1915/1917 synthase